MRRRTLYVILGVAAIVGVIAWRSRTAREPQKGLRTAIVERDTMRVAVSASGHIEPEARVGLTFEAPGRVVDVLVEEDDRVEAGDVLARLDTRQLDLQVAQSEAALELAEAQLAQLRARPRPKEVEKARADLSAAKAQLSAAAAQRDQVESGPDEAEIAAARSRVAQAEGQVKSAQREYDKAREGGTEEEQEHANYDLYTAKQELAAAQANLDDLLNGPGADELRAARADVRAAAAQRDASQAQLDQLLAGTTEEEIADAEAQVVQAEAALKLAKLSLRNATLKAPFDGVVSEVNVRAGEMPPTRRPPIVLLDSSRFHVTVSVDEMDVAHLRKGQTAEVTLDALPSTVLTGTVRSIAPVATIEGGVVTYDVTVDLAPTDARVRADMSANVTILVEELTDVLQIPTWVIQIDRETGQTYVHRRVSGGIERVDVKLGVRHGDVVQVLDGLSEGDEVVRLEEGATFDFGQR